MSLNISQPFTRAEALAVGLTDVELRSRRFQRLFHGLYIRAGLKIGVREMGGRGAAHLATPLVRQSRDRRCTVGRRSGRRE